MSITINGDYLEESLQKITKHVRQQAIKNFLINDFFAGIDAGETGLKVPYFQNMDYSAEADRMITQSKINNKFWDLYNKAKIMGFGI